MPRGVQDVAGSGMNAKSQGSDVEGPGGIGNVGMRVLGKNFPVGVYLCVYSRRSLTKSLEHLI